VSKRNNLPQYHSNTGFSQQEKIIYTTKATIFIIEKHCDNRFEVQLNFRREYRKKVKLAGQFMTSSSAASS